MSYLDISTGLQPDDPMFTWSDCDHKCCTCNFECDDPNFAISTIFEEKGYYEVNTDIAIHEGEISHCLKIYNNKAIKLQKNMRKFGIESHITRIPNGKNYLCWIFFEGYNPEELLHIFRKLEVI